MSALQHIQRLVVKVGSSVLTDERGRMLPDRIEAIADQCAIAARDGGKPLIVSSGAIACGMDKLGLLKRPAALAQLQACAAIGQSELMHLYTQSFARHQMTVAQVLLTQEDLANKERFRNAKQTLLTLLHQKVIPIINENDTVSIEEITFGDNDRLAALVASAVDAHVLVILSDVEGLIQDGKVVERIESLAQAQRLVIAGSRRQTTKGGMASKIEAARIAGHSGIPLIIAHGARPSVLQQILAGESVGTLFVPPRNRLASKKWWIAFALRKPQGSIIIDDGAADALREKGKSLLPAGVREVRGRFEVGAFVSVVDLAGGEVARGVSGISSTDLLKVLGQSSREAAKMLGWARAKDVIHRDAMVLARELQR